MDPAWQAVDPYVEAFERARSAGAVSDLSAFAPPPPHELHIAVLRELVRVDLEFGWMEGGPIPLSDYRQRYPVLFADAETSQQIAFEEYRLRQAAGERPDPAEYRNLGIDVSSWPEIESSPPSNSQLSAGSAQVIEPRRRHRGVAGPIQRPMSLMGTAESGTGDDIQSLLHSRLRFVALGCVAILAYFSLLVLLNPLQKVAFSLQNWFLIAFNWLSFTVCTVLATALWTRPTLSLWWLRLVEGGLFGIMLAQMSLGFFSDLFIDHELREPFTQGHHALFHYGSSWSLPFFALIVSYGVLVPSSWRRCVGMVAAMAIVPVAIGLAAGIEEGILVRSYVQSFLLQMTLWLIAAVGIAVFGADRLESLRQEVTEARRLGQYHLKERLGAGGMGEVYLAEHVLLRRPCAIKLIRTELAGDPNALRRFEHEVQVTATLTHPNTVQIYDYGHTKDGTFYYVMEYLPGFNLAEVVEREGPMRPARVVHILRQICGALSEAHAAGLVHRDLKPSNIILSERGGHLDVAKLVDFGLALGHNLDRNGQRLSREGTVAGSPLFMSPEQAAGEERIDARADIYSLGALMYYLLTAKPPFQRNTVIQTMAAHMHEPVVPPGQLRDDIPPCLQTIILRCLEKDPSLRFPDVGSLGATLDQAASML